MAIRAYSDLYIENAQYVMGHAVDFAVMTLGLEPDEFGAAFLVSGIARQVERGNSKYIAGMNGCELSREVLDRVHFPYDDKEDVMYLDKSPEYWAGWALTYYQWYSSECFSMILSAVPLSGIIRMYPVYHEMDLLQFVDEMNRRMKEAYPESRLKQLRLRSALSQSVLAKEAGVPLRQIQLFEQGQRDINKTSGETLLRLSKALHCRMEDLMEVNNSKKKQLQKSTKSMKA